MQTDTTKKGLEAHIVRHLADENGYLLRENKAYDNVACVDKELLFQFLETTQPKAVARLKAYHKDLYEQKIIKRLNDQIQAKGVIEVLRKGITDGFTHTKLSLFYDQPISAYNAAADALYRANLFSVMRQVYFSPNNKKSLDVVAFINGIPVISFELKNELTKQNVQHAIRQYKEDRHPNEELFRLGRLIVNFAVDTEEVWMCTHLRGDKSYFLPFNKGYNNGASNPPVAGIKTEFLWKEILTKNSLTDIIQNFCQLITEEKEYLDEQGNIKTRSNWLAGINPTHTPTAPAPTKTTS
jgi:type I restriction enzyme R subunit